MVFLMERILGWFNKGQVHRGGPELLDNVIQLQITNANFEVVWNYFYNTAHNELLEYLVTTGVVGMLLKLAIYIIPFAIVWKREEYQAERATIMAGLVTGSYVLTYVIYVVIIAIFVGYKREKEKNRKYILKLNSRKELFKNSREI